MYVLNSCYTRLYFKLDSKCHLVIVLRTNAVRLAVYKEISQEQQEKSSTILQNGKEGEAHAAKKVKTDMIDYETGDQLLKCSCVQFYFLSNCVS